MAFLKDPFLESMAPLLQGSLGSNAFATFRPDNSAHIARYTPQLGETEALDSFLNLAYLFGYSQVGIAQGKPNLRGNQVSERRQGIQKKSGESISSGSMLVPVE